MRGVALFLLLVIAPLLVHPITVGTDKQEYMKGEMVAINGSAPEGLVQIRITNGLRTIYQDKVFASGGSFSSTYGISQLDPKGIWVVEAGAGSEIETAAFNVKPTKEGAYYLVKFTSPPYRDVSYARTDSVQVSVSVFDAGKQVVGASARAWMGEGYVMLTEDSPGVYQGEYEIPFDASLGKTEIYGVVEKEVGGKVFGGENAVDISVTDIPIQIDFVSPSVNVYRVGEAIPIEARITYSTGKPVQEPNITASANEREVALSKKGNLYSGEYECVAEDEGILKISVEVRDSAGNKGYAYKNIEIQGWTGQAITEYYWYWVIGGVMLLVVIIFAAKKFLARTSLEKLEKERETLLSMEKSLQEEYIKKGSIDRQTFEKRMAEYESQLSELNDKIENATEKR